MAWIKFDKDLIDDPRILRAAEELCERYTISIERVRGQGFSVGNDLEEKEHLSMMRNAITGALVTLWVYADTHIRNGDILPISVTVIDQMVGLDGFCGLLGPEWVVPKEDGESVLLPGYCKKNGIIEKEKRKTENAERQRRFRDRHAQSRNAVSNADVTPLDLDLDLDQNKTKNITPLPPFKGGNGKWWESEEATLLEAKARGVNTQPGENWFDLRARIRSAPKNS